MNGSQARLLLDGAFAFTEHIPMTPKEHRKREDAYAVLKNIINASYLETYETRFEELSPDINEWTEYKSRGENK